MQSNTATASTLSADFLSQCHEAAARACARIAPAWPLDRFLAVNPFWGFTDLSMPAVSARLEALTGERLTMPRAWYRAQWTSGRFGPAHLREALAQSQTDLTYAQLLAALERPEGPAPARRALVTDVLDAWGEPSRASSFREFVVHSISQHCAAYFDEGQAQLGPNRERGLYASWLAWAREDRAPALSLGLGELRDHARELPASPRALRTLALAELALPRAELESYLTALLLDVNGWASWCAYRRWTARLRDDDDAHLEELLSVRLAWELLLLRAGGPACASRWSAAVSAWRGSELAAAERQEEDWILHRALELAYQHELARGLRRPLDARAPSAARVQAVFCIDVRSEVYRRALEAQSADLQTLGFAGFFGLPAEYQALGQPQSRPQLPGLLAPRVRITDAGVSSDSAARQADRRERGERWEGFRTHPSSGFSFVEAFGALYGAKLAAQSLGLTRPAAPPERAGLSDREHAARKPRLTGAAGGGPLSLETRCDLAAGILRGMSLTSGFARLVLLLGHGARTVNNPHASGLACGACGGHSGEANARAAAALLNEPEVRLGLAARGLRVPEETRFLAGLHDTTTDEVTLCDLDEVPATHEPDLAALAGWLDAAGRRARAERAPRLGLEGLSDEGLHAALRSRARDWAEVRPEWGLANNAALLLAPRERSRGLTLGGRVFLHEYDHARDERCAVLEQLLTAPMVVAHWINLQYYASTVAPRRYGSGNKVLHNVVGGHLGVFEGNGGDLRIGLPLQSLHDGQRWVHAPLRLSVFVEAPREALDAVLSRHAKVRQLVANEWLYLFQLDAASRELHAWRDGAWTPLREPLPDAER